MAEDVKRRDSFAMLLRRNCRRKSGAVHEYWTLVEVAPRREGPEQRERLRSNFDQPDAFFKSVRKGRCPLSAGLESDWSARPRTRRSFR